MQFLRIASLLFLSCNLAKAQEPISYQPFSTSVIEVTFSQKPTDTVYVRAWTINNIPRQRQRSEKISVVEAGHYDLSLVNDRSSYAFLAVGEEWYKVILIPNDTVRIDVTDSGSGVSFHGRGADINEYYQIKESTLRYSDTRTPINEFLSSSATYAKMKTTIDSIIERELTFFESYAQDNHLPQWFIAHEKAEIVYCGLGFKTSLPYLNLFEDDLPDDYFNFLDGVLIDDPSATSSSFYLQFLNNYFIQGLPVEKFKDLGKREKLNVIHTHILEQSETQLSEEVKKVYYSYLYSELSGLITNPQDVGSLMQKYGIEDHKDTFKLEKVLAISESVLSQGDEVSNFYVVDQQDSLVSLKDFQDKVVYVNLWATWCKPCIKNFPALNSMIDQYENNESVAFLNICISSEKEKWLTTTEQYGVKGTNLFAEGQWSKKLQEIFNMQGYPTYVLLDKGNILYENHTSKAPVVKKSIDELLLKADLSK
ncbi:MAG: TlpA disulfide reductase family protein [Bacteroidota bacterium]